MGMDVSIFSTDAEPDGEERRTANMACSGERRLAIVSISGGLMDLGWANKLVQPVSGPMERLVSGTIPDFSTAVRSFAGSVRSILTHSEREHRWWCSIQFVALELTASRCQLARIGGMRVLAFAQGATDPLGTEDVLSIIPGGSPRITTACLLPDVHWKVAGGGGWVLHDETGEAERMAALVREEQHDTRGIVSIAVLTHPFWTEVELPRAAAPPSHQESTRAIRELVQRAGLRQSSALAAVVRTQS